ncbi:hypothetical protein MCHI_003398, partial [Candidatus Magnetoovum chiemensis]
TKSVLTRLNVQPDAIESTEQLRKFVAAPSAAGSRL